MRKLIVGIACVLIVAVSFGSYEIISGSLSVPVAGRDGPDLELVATYSVICDLVRQVAGDRAVVHSLVPPGQDPHTYEPTPTDLLQVTAADGVFYHGMDLELWFDRFMSATGGKPEVWAVSKGVEPLSIDGGSYAGYPDPHAWMDVTFAQKYVDNICDGLIDLDPGGKEVYRRNADRYLRKLALLDDWIRVRVQEIPPENRLLLTSENSFQYFARAYDFEILGFIYHIAPEDEPPARRVADLVDLSREADLPAVFAETTVELRPLEQIARETGAELIDDIYVDSLGPPGSGADSYVRMMRHNVERFVAGLGP